MRLGLQKQYVVWMAGCAALLAVALAAPAHAAWGWLRGAAVSEFTESDWAVFQATGLKALDDAVDGEIVQWSNDETGAHGRMRIVETFRHSETWCRRIAFESVSGKGTRGRSVYNLCLKPDQTWAFVTDSELGRAP